MLMTHMDVLCPRATYTFINAKIHFMMAVYAFYHFDAFQGDAAKEGFLYTPGIWKHICKYVHTCAPVPWRYILGYSFLCKPLAQQQQQC